MTKNIVVIVIISQILVTWGLTASVPFGPPVSTILDKTTPIGDYDGDGDDDFIKQINGSWVVYENNGEIKPSFTTRTLKLTYPSWLTHPQGVSFQGFHDFEHDGRMECLIVLHGQDETENDEDIDTYLFLGRWTSQGDYKLDLLASVDNYSGDGYRSYNELHEIKIKDLDRDGNDDILYEIHCYSWEDYEDYEHREEDEYIYWNHALGGDPIAFDEAKDISPGNYTLYYDFAYNDVTNDGMEDLFCLEYKTDYYNNGQSCDIVDVRIMLYPRTQLSPPAFGNPVILVTFPSNSGLDTISFITTDYDADGENEVLLKDVNYDLWGLDNISQIVERSASKNPSGLRDYGTFQQVYLDSNVQSIVTGYGSKVIIQKDADCWTLEPSATAFGGVAKKLLFRSINDLWNLKVEDFDRNGMVDILSLARVPDPNNSANSIFQMRYFPGSTQLPLGYYPLATDPYFGSLQVRDINGDRFKEIIYDGRYILNTASQIFTTHSLASPLKGVGAVCSVDLDKDGHLDVLSAAADQNTITWQRNNGQAKPGFSSAVLTTQVSKPADLCAADLDKDGDLDLVVASAGDNTVAWFENTSLSPPVFVKHALTTQASGAAAVAVADLDGDGDLDLLAASTDNNTLWWFENQGVTPPAFKARKLSTSAGGVCAVAVADLDGDGDRDVVCGAKSDDKIIWFENNGQRPPAFTARTVTSKADSVRSVCAADLDHDGDLDLVSASNDDDTIAWYENNGAKPPVWTRRVITTKADGARSVAVADFDNDGDLDVLAASANDGIIAWFENDGGRPLKWWRRPVDLRAIGVARAVAGDPNGDGKPDVVGALKSMNRVNWYENRYTRIKPQTRAAGWGQYR